ncbi:VWA domain-containing protein [Lignipirellula cremea]|uniref:Vault protein inter-alpha-trypsin n=1 Tax=Lignipirellula cremea TaxID=2528010 RepID=A0A518E3N8_9BACT|nr:VWA domain-containing protein [Lignipirellula cremea]QDU98715.1 hypothetical protein Pla8534_65880 [Lignipirellula cremea]
MSDGPDRWDDPRLTAYVLGEMEDAELASFEAELAVSPDLRAEVEKIREAVDLVGRSLGAEPPLQLTSDQRDAIARQAADPAPVSVPFPSSKESPMSVEPASPKSAAPDPAPRSSVGWIATLAVSAALLLVGGLLTWQIGFLEPEQVTFNSIQNAINTANSSDERRPPADGPSVSSGLGSEEGRALPSGYYIQDDVQHFPENVDVRAHGPSRDGASVEFDQYQGAFSQDLGRPGSRLSRQPGDVIHADEIRDRERRLRSADLFGDASERGGLGGGLPLGDRAGDQNYRYAQGAGESVPGYSRSGPAPPSTPAPPAENPSDTPSRLLEEVDRLAGLENREATRLPSLETTPASPKPTAAPGGGSTPQGEAGDSRRDADQNENRSREESEQLARADRRPDPHADAPFGGDGDESAPAANGVPAANSPQTARPDDADGKDDAAPLVTSGVPVVTQPEPANPAEPKPAEEPAPDSTPATQTEPTDEAAAATPKPSGEATKKSGEKADAKGASAGDADKKPADKEKQADDKSKTTWRRAAATPNASRLMIGDHDELPLEGMQVNVQVDGFRARVLLDLYYYNDRGQQLEGAFKLRLPSDASLYYFAFGETTYQYRPMVDQLASKGFLSADLVRAAGTGPDEILRTRSDSWTKVKEARMVPKEKAALAYSETVRRRVDPALVEWSGAGMFNAKVYPLMPGKLHRIVVGYDVNLRSEGDDLVYQLDLPSHRNECTVDIGIGALPGAEAVVTPETRPFVASGHAFYNFKDPEQDSIEVRLKNAGVTLLQGNDPGVGDFFATRFTPELKATAQGSSSRAIFLLDTSLSSNPDKFNVWLKMLESVLEQNRDSLKEFAVLTFSIDSHWYKPGYTANTAENVKALLDECHNLSLEGATDLRQALTAAATPEWMKVGDKETKPDLFLLSDGSATWGDGNTQQMLQALHAGTAGSLFAYNTGLTGTSIGLLDYLARETGGAVFSVATEAEADLAAKAHRNRPWRLIETTVPGGEDLLLAGRVRNLYPGQTLLLTGRGKPQGSALLRVRMGEEEQTLQIPLDRTVESELAPRLYGQTAVGQLEELRSATLDVSVAYARHFRVTGETCSLLMLESEADYQRFGIKPEDDQFVVKSMPAASLIDRKIDEMSARLLDPKATLLDWLVRMEQTPGFTYRTPTALKLTLEQMPAEAFQTPVAKIAGQLRMRADLPQAYFQGLSSRELDYDLISSEADRRLKDLSPADALRALSNLVENNPGDPVLTRDVAFSAMEWGLPGQAYPLLKRVAAIRPYEPQVYQAMAQCLQNSGNADLALVYYEVALNGQWNDRYRDVHRIVGVEYLHLLRRMASGELETTVPQYVNARLDSLQGTLGVDKADLVVAMMWNTDRTDVDLHVVEPSGEEVFYKNRNSRAGGTITRDVTEGFGPEMYIIQNAAEGEYVIKAMYYGGDANRTQMRTKVHLTIFEDFGGRKERVQHKTVTLNRGKEIREVDKIYVEKPKP